MADRFQAAQRCDGLNGPAVLRFALAAFGILISSTAWAAGPTIDSLSLRGLQIGVTTTIAIDGSDLLPDPRLVLQVPIAKLAVRPGGNSKHAEIEVTLDAAAMPGIYNLRLATSAGISNPMLIGIDALAQVPVSPKLSALPAAMSGTISGSQIVETSFDLKKGQRIVVDVEARRLGSALDPVIHLFNDHKLPLAWAEGTTPLGGDARLVFSAPADGSYTIQLHDAEYQGSSPGHFRLLIGDWQYADMAFPPAVRRATATTLEFVSTNFPPTARTEFVPHPAAPAGTPIPAEADELAAPWPVVKSPTSDLPGSFILAVPLVAGFRPRVLISESLEVVKSVPADGRLQEVGIPVGISGRLTTPQGEDAYRVVVAPGMRLHFEVMASRLGSPLDGVLFVRDEKGTQLATDDDQANTVDPALDFTVPANTNAIIVALKDVAGRGGADFVYHLAITRLDQPDFSLALADARYSIPPGGSAVVLVTANRTAYDGPIKLAFYGLPQGVEVFGDEIPAGSNAALVRIASSVGWPGNAVVTVRGSALDGKSKLIRTAIVSSLSEASRQPWLRSEVGVALTAGPAFKIEWVGSSAELELKQGSKTPLPLKLHRGAGATGPVRLALVTTQSPPKKRIRENNKDREVDDVNRSLRIDGSPSIAADQSDGSVQVVVPADLPMAPYQLALRGELLSADGKSVVAESATPILRVKVLSPPPPSQTASKPAAPKQPDKAVPAAEAGLLALFEDQPDFVANLNQGGGQISLVTDDKFSGTAAAKVTPDQRFNPVLPGLNVKIREKPGPGEYRFICFAWKKSGGQSICLQLAHGGQWGPDGSGPTHKFRYHAGPGGECYGASLVVNAKLPDGWTLVTRDLYSDFGEFTLTGLALSPVDGQFAMFDHIYLASQREDLNRIKP